MWPPARLLCLLLLVATASCQTNGTQKVQEVTADTGGGNAHTHDAAIKLFESDISTSGNCSFASAQFCKEVAPGHQKVLRCLTSVLVSVWDGVVPETSLGSDCIEEMMQLKLKLSSNIDSDVYLKKACSDDAKKLCSTKAGRAGAVVRCLRENRQQVSSQCQKEIFRVMREASFDFRLDASLQNSCSEVVEKSCGDVVPGEGRVLSCLNHVAFAKEEELVEGCKKEIVRQMRQDSGDIRLNFQLKSTCITEIRTYCQNIRPGSGATLKCLSKHKKDKGFHGQCLSIVNETERRQRDDLAQNKRLTSGCASDLKTVCKMTEDTLAISSPEEQRNYLHCLIKHRDGLENDCMEEIKSLLEHQFADINMNPDLKDACSEQIQKYCTPEKKGNLPVIDCLIANRRKDLGETCKQELFKQRLIRNENVRFHQPLLDACAPDIESFCPAVEPGRGRVMHCLSKYIQDDQMTADCRKKMDALHQGRAQDYRLNYSLSKACGEDARNFCARECITGNVKSECDGKVIACLQQKAAAHEKLSKECMTEITLVTGIQAQDYRKVEGVADSCTDDVQQFCLNPKDPSQAVTPGEGRIFKCLYKNLDYLSEACKKEEVRFKIMTAGKLKEQPAILMMCQDELATHCSTVHPLQGAILRCLITSHREHPKTFGSDCFSVLREMTQSSLSDYRLNLGVRNKCEKVAQNLGCDIVDDKMDPELNHGTVLNCFIGNYENLVAKGHDHAKCARELVGLVRMGIDFFMPGSPVTSVCDNDVSTLCDQQLVEPGPCLIENFSKTNKTTSQECHRLMTIGFGLQSFADSSDKVTTEMKQLSNQMASLVANTPEGTSKPSDSKDQGLIIAIVAVGIAVVLTVCTGIWLVRKYLNKGYVVLKSGNV